MTTTAGGRDTGQQQPTGREERDELARLVRKLCDSTPASDADICRPIPIKPSTLSGHRKGTRLPTAEMVEAIHNSASACSARAGLPVVVSLDDLLLSRARAAVEQKAARSAVADVTTAAPPEGGAKRATSSVRQAAQNAPAGTRAQQVAPDGSAGTQHASPTQPTAPSAVLPVPPGEGDRQQNGEGSATWSGMEAVARHLLRGRDWEAHLLLTEAGENLPACRIPDIVTDFRSAGLEVAAEAVLHSAGRRVPEERLQIVKLLNSAQRYADAEFLLKLPQVTEHATEA